MILLLALACSGHVEPVVAPEAPPTAIFGVYSLWLEGQGEEHRAELDLFQDCLLEHSTFADFWDGRVRLQGRGSWVVPPPEGLLVRDEGAAAWLGPLLAGASVPEPEPGVTPLYVVYAAAAAMTPEACGYCGRFELDGRPVGLAVVRTGPPCWPGQGAVRGLTQFTQHELSCAVELALGEDHCAADGVCEARASCPVSCDTFTGLYCPGAPERSYTGCDGVPVRGWVVQKLSHRGEGRETCDHCAPCDFAVEAR